MVQSVPTLQQQGFLSYQKAKKLAGSPLGLHSTAVYPKPQEIVP